VRDGRRASHRQRTRDWSCHPGTDRPPPNGSADTVEAKDQAASGRPRLELVEGLLASPRSSSRSAGSWRAVSVVGEASPRAFDMSWSKCSNELRASAMLPRPRSALASSWRAARVVECSGPRTAVRCERVFHPYGRSLTGCPEEIAGIHPPAAMLVLLGRPELYRCWESLQVSNVRPHVTTPRGPR
jgi:hypothetical protein